MGAKLEKAEDRSKELEAQNADLKSRLQDKEKELADFQGMAKSANSKVAKQARQIDDLIRQLEDLKATQVSVEASSSEPCDEQVRAIIESWNDLPAMSFDMETRKTATRTYG